jgi:hypothetical protein
MRLLAATMSAGVDRLASAALFIAGDSLLVLDARSKQCIHTARNNRHIVLLCAPPASVRSAAEPEERDHRALFRSYAMTIRSSTPYRPTRCAAHARVESVYTTTRRSLYRGRSCAFPRRNRDRASDLVAAAIFGR